MNSQLMNPILRLNWLGWSSDTLQLQNNGWDISAEQDVCQGILRVALRHKKAQVHGLSKMLTNLDYAMLSDYSYGTSSFPMIEVDLVHKLVINVMETHFDFEPVDAQPHITKMEKVSFDDLKIFRPVPAKEIVSDPMEVADLMEKILEMQSPKQKKLREKYRRENRQVATQVHAKIVSLVD